LPTFAEYLNNVLIIPKEEFFQHASYKQIQLVNSYEYWMISKEVQFIIVANSEWFTHLPIKKKKELNEIQVKMGRGLILPISFVSNYHSFTEENIVNVNGENFVVLQSDMWKKTSYPIKENLIKEYAYKWDKWTCYEFPENAPPHLKKFANIFPSDAGSNCFSATLFAISQHEWMIHEWVHPQTLMQGLINTNYDLTNREELLAGDVVTWENSEGDVQHASYHLGDHLFFNKEGQTFFNPWKIVTWSEVKEEWDRYTIKIYCKNQ
jgi:hypothetical protein